MLLKPGRPSGTEKGFLQMRTPAEILLKGIGISTLVDRQKGGHQNLAVWQNFRDIAKILYSQG